MIAIGNRNECGTGDNVIIARDEMHDGEDARARGDAQSRREKRVGDEGGPRMGVTDDEAKNASSGHDG